MGETDREIIYLTAADVSRVLDPASAMAALAQGFVALSAGRVQAPPRPRVDVPGKGFALAMLAWMPGQHITLKAVNVYDGNHALALASHVGLITLFDAGTGMPVAIMDAAQVTGVRTAAAAMLSIDAQARPNASIATVIGAGVQARWHVRLLARRPGIEEIRVIARHPEAAASLIGGIGKAHIADDAEAAVAGADIVCLTTSSASPVIAADWVQPGTHVTSVGFAPPGSEVPAALLDRARIAVESRSAFSPAPVGCVELAGRDAASAVELGEVLAGTRTGRTQSGEITLYKSMGNAMEDMVVANLVYEAARAGRVGTRLPV